MKLSRKWVYRFNDEGPNGLIDSKAPGRTRYLDGLRSIRAKQAGVKGLCLHVELSDKVPRRTIMSFFTQVASRWLSATPKFSTK